MMLRKGSMFDDSRADRILVTTNACVNTNGALVMGRGAAKEASVRYPRLATRLGGIIKTRGCAYMRGQIKRPDPYCIVFPAAFIKRPVGAFQVKYGWWEPAELDLITQSSEALRHAAVHEIGKGLVYAVNFPGIGNGRLDRAAVLPIIERLPDNVEVWERA